MDNRLYDGWLTTLHRSVARRTITGDRSDQYYSHCLISSGTYIKSPGLLQLCAVWHHRDADSQRLLSCQYRTQRQADYANRSTWPHLTTCSKGTVLAACSTPCRLQTGHSNVQVTVWPSTAVPIWRMPASARCQSPTMILQLTYMCRPLTRTRLGDRSFAVADPCIWNTLPTSLRLVDDSVRFKHLLKAHLFDAALSDFCLFSCSVRKFSYLLTYLPNDLFCALKLY